MKCFNRNPVLFVSISSFVVIYLFMSVCYNTYVIVPSISGSFSFEEIVPVDEKFNMFFFETNRNRTKFDLRQMCAVESAALNNPDANIKIYSLKAQLSSEITRQYRNIKVFPLEVDEIINQTSIASWWNSFREEFFKGSYHISHLTDILRYVFLHRFGGVYSDLDTITIKSFRPLLSFPGVGNIFESYFKAGNSINVGVMVFPVKHSFLATAIQNIPAKYNASVWSCIGPALTRNLLYTYCNVSDIYTQINLETSTIDRHELKIPINLSDSNNCGVSVYPRSYFYPYTWETVDSELWKADNTIPIRTLLDTYSVHFYGKVSSKYPFKYGRNDIYEFYASKNCPVTYSMVKRKHYSLE